MKYFRRHDQRSGSARQCGNRPFWRSISVAVMILTLVTVAAFQQSADSVCAQVASNHQSKTAITTGKPDSDSKTSPADPQQEKSEQEKLPVSSNSNSKEGDHSDRDFELYERVNTPPDWVQRGSYVDEDTGTVRVVVHSEPRLRQRTAEEELEERLLETVRRYIDEITTPGAADAIGVRLDDVKSNLVEHHGAHEKQGIYTQLLRWNVPEGSRGVLDSETRDAFQCYAQLRLDDEFESWVHSRWNAELVRSRTLQIGLLSIAVMTALGLVFGFLTINHKTRGFYSGRLQTGTFILFLGVVAAVWWLANRFPWF